MKILLCVFLGLISINLPAFSQKVLVDKQKILLGERLHLQLTGSFAAGKGEWPEVDSIPHFEILERSKIDTLQNAIGLKLSQTFTLVSFDSGKWQIPSFRVGATRSAPITVEVVFTTPFDAAQPYHDIKEIIDVEKPVAAKWHWYLLFSLLLIVLFLLFFPRGKKKEPTEFVPDEGAYKTALKKLDALRGNPALEAKQRYTELIDIFRTYLHKRKNIQSFSKTTGDLSVQIRRLDIPDDQYRELVQTLQLSDMVKFARFQPAAGENEEAIDIIKQNIITIERLPDAVQLAPKY